MAVAVEQQLAALGRERAQNDQAGRQLQQKIRFAIAAARAEGISVVEIARLLNIDRSTLYRTYLREAA